MIVPTGKKENQVICINHDFTLRNVNRYTFFQIDFPAFDNGRQIKIRGFAPTKTTKNLT